MATVTKLKNKDGTYSYKISVSLGYNEHTGKRMRETTTFRPTPTLSAKQQEKEVEEFVRNFESRVKNGRYFEGEKVSFYEFVLKWLDYAKQNLEPSTLTSYANYLDKQLIPRFGHIKLADIKPLHLLEFYQYLQTDGSRADGKKGGYSNQTIKKCHAVMSSILSAAYKWELIDSNPCDKVSPPKKQEKKRNRCFTMEQTELFLQALDREYSCEHSPHTRNLPNGEQIVIKGYTEKKKIALQYKVFFYIALFSGCRREEIINIKWNKISFENCTLLIDSAVGVSSKGAYEKSTKNKGSNRLISLPVNVMDLLREYREEWRYTRAKLGELWKGDDYIFIQDTGKRMDISTPSHMFCDLIAKYNSEVSEEYRLPNITLHGLRHTHASLLIAANTDVKTVSARLGHSSPNTTLQVYSHAFRKADEKAADIIGNMFNKDVPADE